MTVRILENYDWLSILKAKGLIQGQWTVLTGEEEDGVAGSEVSPAAFERIHTS